MHRPSLIRRKDANAPFVCPADLEVKPRSGLGGKPSGGPATPTPELKPIKEGGVKPDVVVDLTAQALRDRDGKSTAPREDLILEKALSLYNEPQTVLKKAA